MPDGDAGSGSESRACRQELRTGAFGVGKASLNFPVRNSNAGQRITNEVSHMFEVTRYDHPHIFVTRHRTGETYKFSITSDGTLTHPEAHSGQGTARQLAVEWLAQRARSRELEFA
jgi:hypothetical protein